MYACLNIEGSIVIVSARQLPKYLPILNWGLMICLPRPHAAWWNDCIRRNFKRAMLHSRWHRIRAIRVVWVPFLASMRLVAAASHRGRNGAAEFSLDFIRSFIYFFCNIHQMQRVIADQTTGNWTRTCTHACHIGCMCVFVETNLRLAHFK